MDRIIVFGEGESFEDLVKCKICGDIHRERFIAHGICGVCYTIVYEILGDEEPEETARLKKQYNLPIVWEDCV